MQKIEGMNLEKIEKSIFINNNKINGLFNNTFLSFYPFEKLSEKKIQTILNDLNQIKNLDFSDGLTGISWAISKFGKKHASSLNDILIFLDSLVYKFTINSLNIKNYDFMSGALGGIIYFIERKDHLRVNEFMNIINTQINFYGKHEVLMFKHKSEKKIISFSLAHGLTSILALYNTLVEEGFNIDQCSKKLKNLSIFFIEIISKDKNCLFPNYIVENKFIGYQSRLAWCWGDLGILFQLLRTSIILKDNELNNFIVSELKKLTKYTFKEACIFDSCICHGSSGIAYFFHKIHNLTNISEFKNAKNYWVKKTEELLVQNNYLFYDSEEWINDINFLEGLSGVYIVLKTIKGEINSEWDRALLLS